MGFSPVPTLATVKGPYPGLRPFNTDESEIFFGRDEQTDELVRRLDSTRFLAVLGPSGCGKSSLVHAGLIAKLQAGLMPKAGAQWNVMELRPGQLPFLRLARELVKTGYAPLSDDCDEIRASRLEAQLRDGPLALVNILAERPEEHSNMLIFVDQFEEIFRYHRERNSDEADAFIAMLLASTDPGRTEMPWRRVYVVITMRSDFLGECSLFHGLPDAINRGQYLVPRLTREEIQIAIVGPARLARAGIERELVVHLLNEVGPEPDQLPLLQHALMRLWEISRERAKGEDQNIVLSLNTYLTRLGSIGKALDDHAQEVFKATDNKHLVEVLFSAITERASGKRDTRRPTRLRDIAILAGNRISWSDVADVAKLFREPSAYFLTPVSPETLTEDTFLDIGHESLIRNWSTLGAWVDKEGSDAAELRFTAETAHLWNSKRADLWGPAALSRSETWKHGREHCLPFWARRYVSDADYELVVRFLRASYEHVNAALARDQEAERRKRRERFLYGLSFGAVVLGGLMFWSYSNVKQQARIAALQGQTEQFKTQAQLDLKKAKIEAGERVLVAQQTADAILRRADLRIEEADRRENAAKQKLEDARIQLDLITKDINRADSKGMLLEATTRESLNSADHKWILSALMEARSRYQSDRVKGQLWRASVNWPDEQVDIESQMDSGDDIRFVNQGTEVLLYRSGAGVLRFNASNGVPQSLGKTISIPPNLKLRAASQSGRWVVLGSTKEIRLFDTGTGEVSEPFSFETGEIVAVEIDARDQHVWLVGSRSEIMIIKLAIKESRTFSVRGSRSIRTVAPHPLQDLALVGDEEGNVGVINATSLWSERPADASFHLLSGMNTGRAILSSTFSADGSVVVVAGQNYWKAWRWRSDLQNEVLFRRDLGPYSDSITQLRLSGDGRWLAGGSADNVVRVWETSTGQFLHEWRGYRAQIPSQSLADVSFDGRLARVDTLWSDGVRRSWILPTGPGNARSINLPSGFEVADAWFAGRTNAVAAVLREKSKTQQRSGPRQFMNQIDQTGSLVAWNSPQNRMVLVHVKSAAIQGQFDVQAGADVLAYAVDKSGLLAIGYRNGNLVLADGRTGHIHSSTFPFNERGASAEDGITALAFDARSGKIAAGNVAGKVALIDIATQESTLLPVRHVGIVRTLAFSVNGKMLASGGDDKLMRVLSYEESEQPKAASSVENISHNASYRAGSTVARSEQKWKLAAWTIQEHDDWVMALAFSPDGLTLVSGSDNGHLRLWDLKATGFIDLRSLPASIQSIVFNTDGQRFAVMARKGVVREFERNGTLLQEVKLKESSSLYWQADGTILSVGVDGVLRSVSGDNEKVVQDLQAAVTVVPASNPEVKLLQAGPGSGNAVSSRVPGVSAQIAKCSADGRVVVSLDRNGVAWLDVAGEKLRELRPIDKVAATAVAVAENGQRLAVGFEDGSLLVHDRKLKRDFIVERRHDQAVSSLDFSVDGERLATASGRKISLWRSLEIYGAPEKNIVQTTPVREVQFGRDPMRVLLVSSDISGRIRIFKQSDVKTPVEISTNLLRSVTSFSQSADGSMLVSTWNDGSLMIYTPLLGATPLSTFSPSTWRNESSVKLVRAAFGPDDETLVVVLSDGSVRELTCRACRRKRTWEDWASRMNARLSDDDREALVRRIRE